MMPNQNYDYSRRSSSCWQGRNAAASYEQPQKQTIPIHMAASRPVSQMNREQLLEWVGLTKFACVDANLYLDTHPDDADAIRYFQEYNRLYMEAMNEYARIYGPLTISHAQHCGTWWDWVDQPWPWQ